MKKLILFLIIILSISCNNDDIINPSTQNPVDVYVAGSNNGEACYWKNSQITLLNSSGFTSVRATKITVINNDVYVLGFGFDTNFNINYLYWKNGVLRDLTSQFSDLFDTVTAITDMEIISNDIYFTGFTVSTSATNIENKHVYWKNNTKTILQVFSDNFVITQSKIKVFRNDIYVTGYSQFMNSENFGGYYKNGVFTTITNSFVIDFAINNNDIYVYGFNFLTTSFYYNMISNNNVGVIFNDNDTITQLDFENNDIYYAGTDNKIYKNGTLIYTESAFVSKLKVLDSNLYVIIGSDLIGSSYELKINNITIMTSTGNNQFNDLFIVQN